MTSLAQWMPPPFPPARVLEGQWCRLEPLDRAKHLDPLWQTLEGHSDVWTWLPVHEPKTRAIYSDMLDEMIVKPGIVPFAIIDKADGLAKGHLWLMEIRPQHGVFEVGYITYSPAMQRTRMATEAIYLCGEYGFSLGYRRYEWKCNSRNEPSRRAAERFGFTHEGRFRQHMVVKGENRDTDWYALLDSEWPACGAAFRRWLAPVNFDEAGRQRRGLAACRNG